MTAPRRPGAIQRLAIAALTPIVTALGDRMIQSKQSKRQRRRQRCNTQETELWSARLPQARYVYLDTNQITRLCDQSQSTFFARLPLELRRLIYEYMSGELVQMDESGDQAFDLHPFIVPSKSDTFKSGCPLLLQMLAFPRSCKMAYQEILPSIYASNTFYIPDITSFFCFHRRLPTPHLHAITSLRLRWSYARNRDFSNFWDGSPPADEVAWKQTWHDISNMKSLVHVRVDMIMWVPWMLPEYENSLFSTLKDVPNPERIEVYANWKEDGGEEWPFSVTRGVSDLQKLPS